MDATSTPIIHGAFLSFGRAKPKAVCNMQIRPSKLGVMWLRHWQRRPQQWRVGGVDMIRATDKLWIHSSACEMQSTVEMAACLRKQLALLPPPQHPTGYHLPPWPFNVPHWTPNESVLWAKFCFKRMSDGFLRHLTRELRRNLENFPHSS